MYLCLCVCFLVRFYCCRIHLIMIGIVIHVLVQCFESSSLTFCRQSSVNFLLTCISLVATCSCYNLFLCCFSRMQSKLNFEMTSYAISQPFLFEFLSCYYDAGSPVGLPVNLLLELFRSLAMIIGLVLL